MWLPTRETLFLVTLLRNMIDAIINTFEDFGTDFDHSIEEEEEEEELE